MARPNAALLLLALAACSGEKVLPKVGARYEPPAGFDFSGESAGPPPLASFSDGLSIARFDVALPRGDEDAIAAALPALASLGPGWSEVSARAGTLPCGPVFRIELTRTNGTRALHYVIPRARGFVLLSLVAGEARFGTLEAKVEGSLARLKLSP